MGYDRRALLGVSRLDFTSGDLAGLTVYVRPARLTAFTMGQKTLAVLGAGFVLRRDIVRLRPLFDEFGSHLAAWTLEDQGVPVPVTAWPVQDAAFMFAVSVRWLTEILGLAGGETASVREPRRPAPDAGAGAAEAEPGFDPSAIPMETLTSVPDLAEPVTADAQPAPRKRPARRRVTVPAETAQAI